MAKTATIDDDGNVIVDGEKLEDSAIQDVLNNQQWRGQNNARGEELNGQARTLAAEREAFANEKAAFAQERAMPPEAAPEKTPSVVEMVQDIDTTHLEAAMTADDGEAIGTALKGVIAQAVQVGAAQTRKELQGEVDQTKAELQSGAQLQEAKRIAFGRNKDTIDAYVKRMADEGTPLTAEDRGRLVAHMDSVRNPGEGQGERDRSSGVFVYTERALEMADLSIRGAYWTERAESAGYKKGLTAAQDAANGDVGGLQIGSEAPNPDSSTTEDIFNYVASLPPNSQAATAYMDSLSDAQLNAFLNFQSEVEHREMQTGQPYAA